MIADLVVSFEMKLKSCELANLHAILHFHQFKFHEFFRSFKINFRLALNKTNSQFFHLSVARGHRCIIAIDSRKSIIAASAIKMLNTLCYGCIYFTTIHPKTASRSTIYSVKLQPELVIMKSIPKERYYYGQVMNFLDDDSQSCFERQFAIAIAVAFITDMSH